MHVYFDHPIGDPLFKKFHMFNSGLAPISRYEENTDALQRLRPGTIRVDFFMGDREQEFGNVVDGSSDSPVYHFESLDRFAKLLWENGVRLYWCWCYTPLPLQAPGEDFRSIPTDNERYGEVLEVLSRHVMEFGFPQAFHEVYNEPDCHGNLFAGTMYDYLPMYDAGARGLLRGDPDAVVGGPAEAFAEPDEGVFQSLHAFLLRTRQHSLPLDYFSYHSYGYEQDEYMRRTYAVREMLVRYGLDETELHMNELNVLPPLWEYGTTDLTNEKTVPLTWDCLERLLSIHDLTIVHWAQLINSGVDELSLVGLDGTYYPLFYVFEIYARMPVSRRETQVAENIGCMASMSENRASVVMWNRTARMVNDTLVLQGAPKGTVDIYKLDTAFYNDCKRTLRMKLRAERMAQNVDGVFTLPVSLAPCETLYIEINTTATPNGLSQSLWGRKRYWFGKRKTPAYAEFELSNETVYLGRAGDLDTEPTVSVELLYCPRALKLEHTGSAAMVVVEYGDSHGFRTVAMLGGDRWNGVPWLSTQSCEVAAFPKRLSFAELSPRRVNERVRLTFRLAEMSAEARVEIRLVAEDMNDG